MSLLTSLLAPGAVVRPTVVGGQMPHIPFGYNSQVGWSTFSVQSNVPVLMSAGAQNNEAAWKVAPSAGTYTWRFQTAKGANRGIATVYVDDVSQGTIDLYAAANTAAMVELTGIDFDGTEQELKIRMTTAGTGAGFFGLIGVGALLRTA